MTDKQFNTFLRFVLDKTKQIKNAMDNAEDHEITEARKNLDELMELLIESMKD